jgi:hypothetical protein
MIRYYIHGDYHETNKNVIYCKHCDYFEEKAHFYVAHQPAHTSDYALAIWMLKHFEIRKEYMKEDGIPSSYYRPDNAPNAWM